MHFENKSVADRYQKIYEANNNMDRVYDISMMMIWCRSREREIWILFWNDEALWSCEWEREECVWMVCERNSKPNSL